MTIFKNRWLFVSLVCGLLAASTLWAQRSGRRKGQTDPNAQTAQDPNQDPTQANNGQPAQDEPTEEIKLPGDPKLLELHKQFVLNARKLGDEYVQRGQFDRARACYEEILRLVIKSEVDTAKLEEIKAMQGSKDKKVFDVLASGDWQDTGVILAQGVPAVIKADGTWKFRLSNDSLGADGMEIPKELREFNPGALIGMIEDGNAKDPKDHKPFFVGEKLEFVPEKTGRLLLRMYDSNPGDNTGKLTVQISSSFANGKK
jgi:hypothetical protein